MLEAESFYRDGLAPEGRNCNSEIKWFLESGIDKKHEIDGQDDSEQTAKGRLS